MNAAPYSFFNVVSGDPPLLMVSIEGQGNGDYKDTAVNIRETGQFVVNLVSANAAREMVVTAIDFAPSVSEVDEARLLILPSTHVAPPRLAVCPVAFECEVFQTVQLAEEQSLVIGRVLAMHVKDEAVLDATRCYIDTPKLDLIGRMHGGGWYTRTADLLEVPYISIEEWSRT